MPAFLPGDTVFHPDLVYTIYEQAALRADAVGCGEGPGDDPGGDGDDGPQPFPMSIQAACRRDILSVLNRFFVPARSRPCH